MSDDEERYPITILMDEALLSKLDAYAKDQGVSRDAVVNTALTLILGHYKAKEKPRDERGEARQRLTSMFTRLKEMAEKREGDKGI